MSTTSIDNSKKAILSFLQNADGQSFDICDILFRMISASEPTEQDELFQYACEIYGTIKSNKKTPVPISNYSAQKDRLEEQYGDVVNSIIKTFGQQNTEEKVFYHSIWSIINESFLFDTDGKKIFALFYVLVDKRIPYFKIDASLLYSMSNEHFSELQQKTAREGQKIRFILKSDISQKTERAAILLNEFGITIPTSDSQEAIEEYEKHLMQMVYILREQDSDGLVSLLSKMHN